MILSTFSRNFLKKAFISASILTHWIPDAQLIMETNALDYALAAILSIIMKKMKFTSCLLLLHFYYSRVELWHI